MSINKKLCNPILEIFKPLYMVTYVFKASIKVSNLKTKNQRFHETNPAKDGKFEIFKISYLTQKLSKSIKILMTKRIFYRF